MTFEEAYLAVHKIMPSSYAVAAAEYEEAYVLQIAPIKLAGTAKAKRLMDSAVAVNKRTGAISLWPPKNARSGNKIRDIDPDPINGEWFAGNLGG